LLQSSLTPTERFSISVEENSKSIGFIKIGDIVVHIMDNSGIKKRGRPPFINKIDSPASISSETSSKKKRGRTPSIDKKNTPSSSSQISSKKSKSIQQHEEQRFTDANGTIYPKVGDEVKILFDQKDWYVGTVHDFAIDAKIVSIEFEDEGEIEIKDFPDEVCI
jgi:hypothetical protein